MGVEDYLMITGIYIAIILLVTSSIVDMLYRVYMMI
jgi:hypothetical protein